MVERLVGTSSKVLCEYCTAKEKVAASILSLLPSTPATEYSSSSLHFFFCFTSSAKCHLFEASRVQAPSSSLHLHVFKLHDFSLFLCQRMKNHLAGTKKDIAACTVVDENIKQLFLGLLMGFEEKKAKAKDDDCFEIVSDEDNTKQDGTLNSFVKKQTTMNQATKNREPVVHALCRLLYGEALSFNLVKSPLWKDALKKVGEYGKGLKLPSYHAEQCR
ncbi:hypothetical protein L1887_35050 [Cichorium endivia]|nr:hypothetical protein L1887_35050 [Cichorium endivia]